MEAKKIAVACFVGGATCSAVALMVAPFFWWLGLIAGMAGGYISYEFREFMAAIPVAFHRARRASASTGNTLWNDGKKWLSRPHPFLLFATLVGFTTAALVLWPSFQGSLETPAYSTFFTTSWFFMLSIIFVQIASVPVTLFAFIGARYGEKCYWWPFLFTTGEDAPEVAEIEKEGLVRKPLTYGNVLRWMMKGVGLTLIFFGWTIWKYLGIGVWKLLGFLVRFGWHLFKLVHSSKRVLCALDGTLGGAVTFLWLAPYAATLDEKAIVVVFGGLIGAVLGVVHWKAADKYLPKVNEVA